MTQANLKTMTRKELKAYILEHRNDDEQVRAAIAESQSRPGWTTIPADAPAKEVDRILKELIERKTN